MNIHGLKKSKKKMSEWLRMNKNNGKIPQDRKDRTRRAIARASEQIKKMKQARKGQRRQFRKVKNK